MEEQNTLTYLDSYCERAGDPAFWAEPLNAVTNIAFIVAAIFAARALRGHSIKRHFDLWLLTITLFTIGIGSGLWHTHATQNSMLADIIPIGIFIHVFLLAALRRALKLSWFKSLLGLGVFIGASAASEAYLSPDMLNGSVMYLPAVAALALVTLILKIRGEATAKGFAIALGVFLLSITFRTVDLSICSSLPLGTHFLWHVLNAYVLYRLLMALVPAIHRP